MKASPGFFPPILHVLVAVAGMALIEADMPARARADCPGSQRVGSPGGFEIDGDLIPCVPVAPGGPIPVSFDWFNVSSSCRGILVPGQGRMPRLPHSRF